MGFKARLVLSTALLLACVQGSQGSHLVLHLSFAVTGMHTVIACILCAFECIVEFVLHDHRVLRHLSLVARNYGTNGAFSLK